MKSEPSAAARRAALAGMFCLVLLVMLPNLALMWFGTMSGGEQIESLLAPTIFLAVLFAIFGERPWLACILLLPFALIAPLQAYYIGRYHHPTSPEILATIFASNARETREYLGDALLPLILCEAIATIVVIVAVASSWRFALRWRNRSRAWILTLAIVVPMLAATMAALAGTGDGSARLKRVTQAMAALSDPFQQSYPLGIVAQLAEYHRESTLLHAEVARLDAFRFHAHRIVAVHRRQVYVLVIGEASRRDHWQLFGYDRATNPELSRVHNLVPIPDMLSSWPESITAIPMLITRRPPDSTSMTWNEASVLRAMDEAGFDTWWISNQMPLGVYDSPVAAYAYEAKHTDFVNHTSWFTPGTYDDDVLRPFRDALRGSNRDLFIVLHLMGSHQRYDFRYPAAYRRFQPTELGPPGGSIVERSRNSYDNSILYTDHILATIIATLRDTDAVTALMYASDHGESLPTSTCSLTGHGNGTRYEYEISALFWASDAYVAAFSQRVTTFRANATRRTLSADMFESLIDMANVTFPGHDPSWSLFDPGWRYRPRTINRPWQADMDQAGFGKNCQIVIPRNG